MRALCALAVAALFGWQSDPSATLQLGPSIERQLSGTETHTYQLSLDANSVARLTVDQHRLDVAVRVEDASGARLADFDLDSRPDGHESIIVIGDAKGPVRITVKATYPKLPAGAYAIRVDEIRAATDRDRDEFEAHKLATSSWDLENAGKFKEALAQENQALTLAERAIGPKDIFIGMLLLRCGELNRTNGDTAEAERFLTRALANDDAVLGRENPQTAFVLTRLGALYTALDDYTRSEPLLDEAVAIGERTLGPDHPRISTMLIAQAIPRSFLDDNAFVIACFERALKIAERTLDPDDFGVLALVNNLGDVYSRIGDYAIAEQYDLRALAGLEKKFGDDNWRVATPLLNLGKVLREQHHYDRALELSWRGYRIREKAFGAQGSETASALISIGTIYRAKGDYPKALDTFQRALDAVESRGPYFHYTLLTLDNLANTYEAQGDIAKALAYRTRADRLRDKQIALNLAVGSERQKLQYASQLADWNDRTISLHARLAPDNPDAAAAALLILFERKGQVLDAMSGGMVTLRERMNADDRAMFDQLTTSTTQLATLALGGPGKTPLDEYKQQLAAMEAKREQLEVEIGRHSPEFRARAMPVTIESVQQAIPAEAALVEFATYRPFNAKAPNDPDEYGASRYIAYVLRREGGIQFADLGEASAIDASVVALRQALRSPLRHDVKSLSRATDARVLEPLRRLVGDATRLLISPDGELNLIPFEALRDERGRFAIERFSISYLTSGRDLLRLQLPRASKSAPLIVADPTFGPAPQTHAVYFTPLPGTALEAQSIKTLFPDATVLRGTKATKAALAHAEAPALLHIATHGFFLQNSTGVTQVENPLLRSGLALSSANARSQGHEEGVLTALEASTLNLWGTRLVTLSGCDTGVGDIKNGEGVYGLRRAFLLAGAETLVMSLWSVSDFATREMMTSYYRGLKQGLGRGEALRQAQLAMLKRADRRHPFYWASFIQAGDWSRFDSQH